MTGKHKARLMIVEQNFINRYGIQKCWKCNEDINHKEPAVTKKGLGKRKYYHEECAKQVNITYETKERIWQ